MKAPLLALALILLPGCATVAPNGFAPSPAHTNLSYRWSPEPGYFDHVDFDLTCDISAAHFVTTIFATKTHPQWAPGTSLLLRGDDTAVALRLTGRRDESVLMASMDRLQGPLKTAERVERFIFKTRGEVGQPFVLKLRWSPTGEVAAEVGGEVARMTMTSPPKSLQANVSTADGAVDVTLGRYTDDAPCPAS